MYKKAKVDLDISRKLQPTNIEIVRALKRVDESLELEAKERKTRDQMGKQELKDKLTDAKDDGNAYFKKGDYHEAVAEFGKGVAVYQ